MDSIPTYAVIPTCGRPELAKCLDSLSGQVNGVLAITNGEYLGDELTGVHTVHDPGPDRNISRWWNLGLRHAARLADGPAWNTLILNDDATIGTGSVALLTERMRVRNVSLAFPGPGPEQLLTGPDGPRITGWCFVVPGEDRMAVDETFAWWCGDNDLDHWARTYGRGSLCVPGIEVQHTAPNVYTNHFPELGEQTARDVEAFRVKWGRNPY